MTFVEADQDVRTSICTLSRGIGPIRSGMVPLPRSARVVRERGDRGRVVQYTNESGQQVYAKVYPTAAEAHRCVEVLTALREAGFHSNAPYQVPAVLEHRPEERVVVLAAAPGVSLASLVRGGTPPGPTPGQEPWRLGVQGAARWLAALHDAPLSVGRSTDIARPPTVRLQARREALVAASPRVATETADVLQALAGRAPRHTPADRTTHGRYHPEHVFLEPTAEVVTGIDLDRASPGDPARDLGEFVHRARALLARSHRRAPHGPDSHHSAEGSPGDRATALFLAEYRRSRGGGADLSSLAYQWSFAILWHLFGSMAKNRSASSLDRHRTEFAAVPRLLDDLARE